MKKQASGNRQWAEMFGIAGVFAAFALVITIAFLIAGWKEFTISNRIIAILVVPTAASIHGLLLALLYRLVEAASREMRPRLRGPLLSLTVSFCLSVPVPVFIMLLVLFGPKDVDISIGDALKVFGFSLLSATVFVGLVNLAIAVCVGGAFGNYICCENCLWNGHIMDIRYRKGHCPKCGGLRFAYAEKTEDMRPYGPVNYRIHRNATFPQLESEWSHIWIHSPCDWWHRLPGSLERAQTAPTRTPFVLRVTSVQQMADCLMVAGIIDGTPPVVGSRVRVTRTGSEGTIDRMTSLAGAMVAAEAAGAEISVLDHGARSASTSQQFAFSFTDLPAQSVTQGDEIRPA